MNYETPDGTPEAEFDPELESWLELARQSNNRNQLVRLLQAVLGGKSGHHRIRQPYEEATPPEPYYMNDPTNVSPAYEPGTESVGARGNHLLRLLGSAGAAKR